MLRSILLTLGPSTTATHCGDCSHLTAEDAHEPRDCRALRVDLDAEREPHETRYRYRRHARCVAAECASGPQRDRWESGDTTRDTLPPEAP